MKTLAILAATALATAAVPAVAKAPGASIQAQQTIDPGTVVLAADGSELGRLEGSRTNADGEAEVVIRDSMGEKRAIPAAAVALHGEKLHATWSAAEFRSAPALVPMSGGLAVGASGTRGPRTDPDNRQTPADQPGFRLDDEDPTRLPAAEQQQAPR